LPRLATYAIGTAAIVGWASLFTWLYAATVLHALLLLWIVTASAGGATLLAWAITAFLRASAKARAGEITEKALRDGRD
jgi:hypothetical protein